MAVQTGPLHTGGWCLEGRLGNKAPRPTSTSTGLAAESCADPDLWEQPLKVPTSAFGVRRAGYSSAGPRSVSGYSLPTATECTHKTRLLTQTSYSSHRLHRWPLFQIPATSLGGGGSPGQLYFSPNAYKFKVSTAPRSVTLGKLAGLRQTILL